VGLVSGVKIGKMVGERYDVDVGLAVLTIQCSVEHF
jgi:hypothetical protein